MKKKILILSLINLLLLPIASFNLLAEILFYTGPINSLQLQQDNNNRASFIKRPSNTQTVLAKYTISGYGILGVYTFSTTSQPTECYWKEEGSRAQTTTWTLQGTNVSFTDTSVYPTTVYCNFSEFSKVNGEWVTNLRIADQLSSNQASNAYYNEYHLKRMFKHTGYYTGETEQVYGEIADLKYYSNLLTSNPAGNIDTIYWNGYQDTLGNDITNLKIEIKAESGYFTAQDRPSLLQETFANWIRDTKPSVQIYKGTTLQEKVAVEWQTIGNQFKTNTETLGQFFWSIFAKEGWWYQYGWRYYARLLDTNEEPISEWQELIQATSYTPQATETLTDDEPLTPDDVDTINDINNQNNTTNNWYVNNTVINNNEYNNTYQQNIIENIYNILQGTPDGNNQQLATDTQNTVDNAIDTEDDYTNQLQNQLNDLDLNDISQNNGLIKALRWVREVHKETIEQTEFGEIVLTVMLIGLITYLIGRRNG